MKKVYTTCDEKTNYKSSFFYFFTDYYIHIFCCKSKKVTLENCNQIKKIKILNKTSNKFITDSVVITDQNSINDFCNIIHSRTFYGTGNTKSNFGYYDVIAYFADGTKTGYDIIYTVYDGVIIIDPKREHYKNDDIINFILTQFQK